MFPSSVSRTTLREHDDVTTIRAGFARQARDSEPDRHNVYIKNDRPSDTAGERGEETGPRSHYELHVPHGNGFFFSIFSFFPPSFYRCSRRDDE